MSDKLIVIIGEVCNTENKLWGHSYASELLLLIIFTVCYWCLGFFYVGKYLWILAIKHLVDLKSL